MANNYNFDTDFTVHGILCINCQTLHNSNYNNLLKYESHILKLGFQVSGYYFLYRLKSTTENSVLAHARENGNGKQVHICWYINLWIDAPFVFLVGVKDTVTIATL